MRTSRFRPCFDCCSLLFAPILWPHQNKIHKSCNVDPNQKPPTWALIGIFSTVPVSIKCAESEGKKQESNEMLHSTANARKTPYHVNFRNDECFRNQLPCWRLANQSPRDTTYTETRISLSLQLSKSLRNGYEQEWTGKYKWKRLRLSVKVKPFTD